MLLDSMWGSAFDLMPGDCVGSVVGWVGLMVADVAEIQLIVFAWNAAMVQAKTLKCKLEVNIPCKHPCISSSQSRCSAIQSQLHHGHLTTHASICFYNRSTMSRENYKGWRKNRNMGVGERKIK